MKTTEQQFNMPPCVGRCSTVYGDPICRGCKRFMSEVLFWNQLSLKQRKNIWLRLDQLAIRIMPQFVIIFDSEMLVHFLKTQGIRFPKHLSQESWALHCIENWPKDLDRLHHAGISLIQNSPIQNIKQLQINIQKNIYALSLAEKERHLQIPQTTVTF